MPTKKVSNPIAGSERALRAGSRLIGPSNPDERVEITVRVRSRGPKLVTAQRIGALPPLKRRYLSREEFAKAYGAAPADLAKVTTFAAKNGLEVVSVNPAERHVKLAGTVRALSAAFDVKLMEYAHADGDYRGRIGSIHLPAGLANVVQGVFGLDNRRQARPHISPSKEDAEALARRGAGTFTAPQVAQLYNFPPGLDGTGECIGILEFGGGYSTSDLATYFKNLGIAMPSITSVSVNGVKNSPGKDPNSDGEVALDIEVAGAVAPGAKIVVYFAHFTERGWVDSLAAAMSDSVNRPSVISISWGFAEGEPIQGFEWTKQTVQAVNETLQAAAAMGVTVCAASGDDGSNDQVSDGHAHVDFPASSPYSLGCGGTRLTAANNKIADEVVWNDGPGSGGGGGVSAMNSRPTWQAGIVPPSVNPGHSPGRGVPDVCGNADPNSGYQIYYAGRPAVVGGTSAVAPLWAGLLARINQKLGKPVGYFNPLLYSTLGKSGA
ncbi:MAG TPA: S53 family peptidase, partial [Candidatus Sulfotelmatobacter sp.]|nr:S53 family peptidase [Candidatus Sulfotelmatobacter sp.]